MVSFDFYCPSCNQVATGTADPADLLFVAMGRKGLVVTCENCDKQFNAIVNGEKISIGAELWDGRDD